MPKKLFVNILAVILMVFVFESHVHASDSDPPEVINKQISSSPIAYKGNSVPGYLSIMLETNEPTRGYVMAVGNGRQTKINLSTTDFKTTHVVHWSPWDDEKKEPLPPGTYQLKSYLTDSSYNSAQGFPLGQITVVSETNPKSLVTLKQIAPSSISPRYSVNEALTEVQYELSRHADVQIAVQKDGAVLYQTSRVKLEPGQHSFKWNGRDQKGNIVRDGDYEIVFKTIELNFNYPATTQTIEKLGLIKVANGENQIPQWRLKEIVQSASFNSQEITPNNDGVNDTVSGQITVSEPVNVTVFMATLAGSHMNRVLSIQDLKPGSHSFTWNGTDMMGGKAINGQYFIKVMVTESNGATGYITFNGQPVTVKESTSVVAAEPVKQVRVTSNNPTVQVYPMSQGYQATKGEVFPLISDSPENGYYQILVKDQVPGQIPSSDVELVEASPASPPLTEPVGNVTIHTVISGDTLWKIAQKYEVTIVDIVQLNSLDVDQHLFVGQKLKIPTKTVDQPVSTTIHTVQSGDTLWKIAQKYGVTVDAIVKINHLNETNYLWVGQKLTIPSTQQSVPNVPTENRVHTVVSGDTLWKIAQKYQVTMDALVKINNLTESQYLMIGQKLTIPTTQQPTSPQMIVHAVVLGDTLWKIAQKYQITVQQLAEFNQIDVNQPIMVGQTLNIPTV
ncbi:LysM peptidoglycan-binding domain-containing protein [Halalkalibacter alkalisediminis]|uniref:LysM peptidoglycan-binding domain-containing protein n=1 Tax=Halalkalibacter alkalisediminis TaxID=935616 RepID=A0ABV6NKQ4_9BACI|nr:LysM peptidoglycan-binding domain-containing protein [Halalkalibacter alkalisediminis]